MMGTSEVPVQNPVLPYFSVMFVVLVGVVIVSVGGLVYFLMFPEIKTPSQAKSAEQFSFQNATTAYEAIVKTLTDEERKVIQVLTAHNGTYLQKYIRKEAGLSRLKTHRILARLADRGIVTLKKSGNTNEVQLADWLNK
jgi:predicted transcriptional regulator